jgi:hypothetical protein
MHNIDKAKAMAAAKRIATSGIVFGIVLGLYTLFVSRTHITHIGYAIGLPTFEAETLFLLVDFIAIFGKLLTNRKLSAKTRRIGRQGMKTGLILSLICNVASGLMTGGYGAAGYGAFIVGMLLWIEYAVANIKPKTSAPRSASTTPAQPARRTNPVRSEAARKGHATRAAKAAAMAE